MSEINLGNLNGSDILSRLGLASAAGTTPNAKTPSADAGGDAFMNLLNLVSDLSLSEEQSGNQETSTNDALTNVRKENLGTDGAASLMTAAWLKDATAKTPAGNNAEKSVGRLGTGPSEILSANKLAVDATALNTKAELGLVQKGQALANQPTAEAVAQWAAALASGDVQSVTVEPEKLTGAAKAETPVQNPAAPNAVAATAGQNVPAKLSVAVATAAAVENLGTPATAPALPAGAAKAASTLGGSARPVAMSQFLMDQAPVTAVTAQNSSDTASDFSDSGSDKSSRGRSGDAKVGPQSGADFVLNQSVDTRAVNAPVAHATAISDLKDLGEVSDKRIPSEALGFVADKIDALKAQGGGTLRVQMSPGDLGSVEIRVGMARGKISVQLLAEKPETLAALGAAKGELMGRLGGKASASLELARLDARPTASVVSHGGSSASMASAARTSEAMLDMRAASKNAPALQMHAAEVGALRGGAEVSNRSNAVDLGTKSTSSESGVREMSSARESSLSGESRGWGRDERREKAFDRWEELFGRRAS